MSEEEISEDFDDSCGKQMENSLGTCNFCTTKALVNFINA